MKNKVLYIGGFEMPDKNAAAHRVIANAMTLRELGYKVSFIGPTKDRTNIVNNFNGFNCEYIDYPQSLSQWIKYILVFIPKNKILKYNPDYVILYNFPAIASLKILRACHKKGIRVIHDLTEWESSKGASIRDIVRKIDINIRMHYCIKKMDGVIAISRYLYEYYTRYTKTILVPPTVDLNNSKFNRKRSLTANQPIQLVYAGNNNGGTKDRIDCIIDSLHKIKTLKLIVIGMTLSQYERIYGNLPKDCDNIIFKGRLSHNEAVQIVSTSDFQILIRDNTLKNMAGFPTKFVESMSCCIPVIATVSSNICDFLVDGNNGFIVDESTPLDVVLKKVSQLEYTDIIKMKERCRDMLDFDYRNYKDEFLKIFA